MEMFCVVGCEQDYSEMSVAYRPSHADATYDFKYGVRAIQVLELISESYHVSAITLLLGINLFWKSSIADNIAYLFAEEELLNYYTCEERQLLSWISTVLGSELELLLVDTQPMEFDIYTNSCVQGGGRSSARETIGRVAAGAVAKKLLKLKAGTEVCKILHLTADIRCRRAFNLTERDRLKKLKVFIFGCSLQKCGVQR